MSRILYVECHKGRPALSEEGFGCCTESLTTLEGDPSIDNWLPYVPASVADGRIDINHTGR